MANLGGTITLVDINGNPLGGSLGNPFTAQLAFSGGLVGNQNPLPISNNQLTDTTGTTTIVAGAAGSASLAAVVGKTNFIRGFCVSSQTAAAPVSGLVTITNVPNSPLNFQYTIGVNGGLLFIEFQDAIAAPAQNLAITVNLAAITGGSASAITVWGNVQ